MSKQFTGEPFQITPRHYTTIIDQVTSNLPKETGGFLGGNGRFIKGILPLFNSFIGDKTGTFGFHQDDAVRAREFFAKHKLDYLGVYHSHPIGSAQPSEQDLKHIQQYMFIISMKDPNSPDFACYEVQGKKYNRVDLHMASDAYSVQDIHSSSVLETESNARLDLSGQSIHLEDRLVQSHVNDLLGDIISDRPSSYQKRIHHTQDDDDIASSFSTVA